MNVRHTLATVVVGMTVSACSGLLPGDPGISITRNGQEIRVAAPAWPTRGAQVYLCPAWLTIAADRRDLHFVIEGAGCTSIGQIGADVGVGEAVVRLDELEPADRAPLVNRDTWSIVVLEFPEPAGRPATMVQQEIPGDLGDDAAEPWSRRDSGHAA